MKYFIEIIKFGLLALAVLIVGLQFAANYKTQIKGQAISDCYNQSFYQVEYQEGAKENAKKITTRETQKYIYDQCLLDKGIVIPKR